MQLHLDAVPSAIRRGRRWAVEQARAGGADEEATRVVELLTSELVTNAVKYGPKDGAILVSVGCRAAAVDVAVHDEGDDVPVQRRPGPTAVGGRGLRLVDQLADEWGVRVGPRRGKSVWFRIALRTAAGAAR